MNGEAKENDEIGKQRGLEGAGGQRVAENRRSWFVPQGADWGRRGE